jgi:hypothetical protein
MILVRRELLANLRNDSGYRKVWIDTIAKYFIDSCEKNNVSTTEYVNDEDIERIANEAAQNFIDKLIS